MNQTTEPAQAAPPPPPVPPQATASPVEPSSPGGRGRSGSTVLGVFLIFLGIAVLAGQFAFEIAWWALWPLIVIVAGVVQAVTPGKDGWSVGRLFEGVLTVAWGLFFLALTTGVVSWSVWLVLLTLWPVLLIAIGFDLLGRALHTDWTKMLSAAVIIAAIVYASAVSAGGFEGLRVARVHSGQSFSLAEPLDGTREAKLRFDSGLADVHLSSGDDLVSIEGDSPWGEPTLDVNRSGDEARVEVSMDDGNGVWMGGDYGARLDLRLSREVLWDAVINTGVSSLDADLSDLSVKRLELKPGVADCTVKLGEVPDGLSEARVDVRSGVSSVALRLPSEALVRIESNSGLSGVNVDDAFESRGGGIWESEGYEAALDAGEPVWNVNLKSGVGSVDVDTY